LKKKQHYDIHSDRRQEMKTKKINLSWKSLAIGMVLCAILVVFLGSKAFAPQTVGQERALQRAATMTDVWEKTNAMEVRLAAMDERLVRLEQKLDALNQDMVVVLRVLKRLDPR